MAELNNEQRKALLRLTQNVAKLVPNKEILNGFSFDIEKIEKEKGRILKISDNEVMVLFDNRDSLSIKVEKLSVFVQHNLYSNGRLERTVININGSSVELNKVEAIEDYDKTLLKRKGLTKKYQDNELVYERNFESQTTFTLVFNSCYSKETILQVAPNGTAYVSETIISDGTLDRPSVVYSKCDDYKPELFDNMTQKEEISKQEFVPCDESEYKSFKEENFKIGI